jgi:hypothetical protein
MLDVHSLDKIYLVKMILEIGVTLGGFSNEAGEEMDLYLLKSSAGKSFVRRPLSTVVVSKRPHQTAFPRKSKENCHAYHRPWL